MKVLFICGSLEPGKDGVGDYTRRLAGELKNNGINVTILSMFDKSVTVITEETQVIESSSISVCRLPASLSNNSVYKYAKLFIEKNNPTWVSLQFVLFSFHNKGLPIYFAWRLKFLIRERNVHIMFHELWVGIKSTNSIKERIISILQKSIVKLVLYRTKPKFITTSIELYKNTLGKNTFLLPLYSNIPVIEDNRISRSNQIHVVHFGTFTLHFEEFKKQVNYLHKLKDKFNSTILIQIIGKISATCLEKIKYLEEEFGTENIRVLGFKSESEISKLISNSDIGLSRANFEYVGKSGSTLALFEHGLPVLLRGERPAYFESSKDLVLFKDLCVFENDAIDEFPNKCERVNMLSKVSHQFIDLLKKNEL